MARQKANPKRRDASATQRALLDAALKRFATHGYDQVGLRDIAADASVDPALINRYFGSKAGLFSKAISRGMDFSELLEGPRSELGFRLASYIMQKDQDSALDPLLAQIRSAANEEAGHIFKEQLEQTFIIPLADWLGGARALERAGLIAAELTGLATMRSVVRLGVFNQADNAILIEHAGKTLQTYVDG